MDDPEAVEVSSVSMVAAELVQVLDASYAEQLANTLVERQGLTGERAERARKRVHGLISNLQAKLTPGERLPLDAVQPTGATPTHLVLEKGSDGVLRMLRTTG